MNIDLDTSIRQLYKASIISVRTFNCLRYADYVTVGDVVSKVKDPKELRSIRNFGKKCYDEMVLVYESIQDKTQLDAHINENCSLDNDVISIIEDAYDYMVNTNIDYKDTISSLYANPVCLHNTIVYNKEKLLEIQTNLTQNENIIVRICFKSFVKKVLDLVLQNSENYNWVSVYNDALLMLEQNYDKFSELELYTFFEKEDFKNWIQSIFDNYSKTKLSVRAKHFQEKYFPKVEDIIPYFDSTVEELSRVCIGHNPKLTINELFLFIRSFKNLYFKNKSLSGIEIKALSYTFLLSHQKKFIINFHEQYGHFPYMFLLFQYMRISVDSGDRLYSLQFGIFDGKERTLDEVGKLVGLSREGVRQKIARNVEVKKRSDIIDGFYSCYEYLKSIPYLTESSKEYLEINEIENLNLGFRIFSRLLSIVFDFSVVEIKGHTFMVNNQVLCGFDLKQSIKNFEKLIYSRNNENQLISIDNVINSTQCRNVEIAKKLLSDIFSRLYFINTIDDNTFVFEQNYVDVSKEIFLILEQNGSPMSLDSIFQAFKEKYPNHKYSKPSDLRSYIQRIDNVKSIGKQSTYALDFWDNINFGSIRDVIIDILSSSNEPVNIEEILAGVEKYYPETNLKSITSSMQADDLGRFVRFEGGYYGLSNKEYSEEYKIQQTIQRKSFEERIEDYKQFVSAYHRLPTSNENDLEGSLYRWAYHVINKDIDLNNEQLLEFNNLMEYYDRIGYPRNNSESLFLNNCDNYKAYIDKNHCLPTPTKDFYLYSWFRRAKENFNTYIDHRRDYFIDLVYYIRSYGFSV